MTIHFIGAGPGAPDLITVRALNLIKQADICLYAGSLVPVEILDEAPEYALKIDTAPMVLDDIVAMMVDAHNNGKIVTRIHSGDPSLYGAIGEQMRLLDEHHIPYDICPGVPAYAAASAILKKELTLADVSQSIILTRTAIRSTSMPNNETLEQFAKTGATLAIHLSINNLAVVTRTLIPFYGQDCPVAIIYRATWPDELVIQGTLSDIRPKVKKANITRTALILVGDVLAANDFTNSALYDSNHHHVLRERSK